MSSSAAGGGVSSGPQVDVALHSVFASRKRASAEDEKSAPSQPAFMYPSNFQVHAKIDEESRKDNLLVASFLLTLNDVKGMVTYEFRGTCSISGSSADFESVMEANKNAGSRVPRILDVIYQKLYPSVFMLAGMTASSYPQSIAVLTEMVSSQPIPVHQEISTGDEKVAAAEPAVAEEPPAVAAKEKKPLAASNTAKVAAAK